MPDLLDIIERRESGGQNVPNYKYGPGFSASGNFQIIDETWRRWAKKAGIDISQYPRAIDAPYDVQRAVAAQGLKSEGTKPWKAMDNYKAENQNYTPPLGALSATGTAPPMTPRDSADLTAFLVTGKDPSILKGVGGDLSSRFSQMVNAAPEDIRKQLSILSAYRTKEHQQRLWDASDKSGKMVARPGHSQHEHGNALDLRYASPEAQKWAHANAANYGLTFPMSYEPWHIETAEARGGTPSPTAAVAEAPPASPPPGVLAAQGPTSPIDAFNTAYQGVTQAQDQQAAQQKLQQLQAAPPPPQQQALQNTPPQTAAADLMTALINRKRQGRIPPLPGGLLG